MKKSSFLLSLLTFLFSANAQNISGVWEGRIIRLTDYKTESNTVFKQNDCRLIITENGNNMLSLFILKDSIEEKAETLITGMSGFVPKKKANSYLELFRDPKVDRSIPINADLNLQVAYTSYIQATQIEKDNRIFLVGFYSCKQNNTNRIGPFTNGFFVIEKTNKDFTENENRILTKMKPTSTENKKNNFPTSPFNDARNIEQYILSLALLYNKGKIIPE
ncbi:MAG: hypothetical protein K2X37_00625 [Chitinophagaceae bacterium]|nr:hypothetical protein [Chitinophagaceae bacterium]